MGLWQGNRRKLKRPNGEERGDPHIYLSLEQVHVVVLGDQSLGVGVVYTTAFMYV